MSIKTHKRMLPSNQIRVAISENSVNSENRSIELTWTTGAKGMRYGWEGRYYEELSLDPNHVDMSRLHDGAPLLAAHNDRSLDAVIGVVERAWIEGNQGKAVVRFASDAESEKVFQKVKDRILRNVSVGYSVQEYTNVSQQGDEIPTYRATRWQPAEISIVPIGFDQNAKTRNQELTESEVEIIERSENNQEEAEMPKENQPVAQQVDAEALKNEAVQAERQRSAGIRKMVREAELQDSLAEDMIERGLSLDEAKKNTEAFKRAIDESKKTQVASTVRVEVGASDEDKKREGIVEAILPRMDSRNFQHASGNPFNGYSLLRMFEALIPRRPGEAEVAYATRVMSSSDLPYILASSGEKAALKKYQIQPRTWSRWASTDTLRNFKTKDLVRSGDFSSLEEVQENGEIKRGSFGEEREQVALKEYAKMLSFTRRMLINDDLGEIAKVIAQAGSAAARLENKLVYEQLTSNPTMGDGVALFHANHSNLATGGDAAALSDTTIGYAFQSMRGQTSVDGLEKLNLAPKYLICGPSNEVLARKYLAQISPTQASNVNVFSSSLELIVDSEITSNDYFFAADQMLIPTVTLFRLDGQEQPRVASQTNFETSSVDVKCEHACVAKAIDWRGLQKNPNAN